MLSSEVRTVLRGLGEWPMGQPITLYWPKKGGVPAFVSQAHVTEAITYPSTVDAIAAVWAVCIAKRERTLRYPTSEVTAPTP